MMADRVLIDTCIWASVFAKPASSEHHAAERLIEEERVVVIGPVLTEVLYGFRRREQAEWAASRLRNLGWIHVERDDWEEAFASSLSARSDLRRTLDSRRKRPMRGPLRRFGDVLPIAEKPPLEVVACVGRRGAAPRNRPRRRFAAGGFSSMQSAAMNSHNCSGVKNWPASP